MKLMYSIILILFLVGCPSPKNPMDIDSGYEGDTSVEVIDADFDSGSICDQVCNTYTKLGCEEAKVTPEGHSCLEVCTNLLDSQIPGVISYYECIIHSTSCNIASDCY